MTREETASNHWIRRVAVFATAIMALWVCAGWIIDKGWTLEGLMLAAMSAALQALAWNASAQMRRAGAAGVGDAREFWRWTLIVCAGWSAFSAHHAYGVITGAQVSAPNDLASALALMHSAAALVVLTAWAFIEPLLGWAIEKTEAASAHRANAASKESARRLALVSGAAVAFGAAITAPAQAPVDVQRDAAHAIASRGDNARDHAMALYEGGERNAAEIARRIGAPASTVRRWIADARERAGALTS